MRNFEVHGDGTRLSLDRDEAAALRLLVADMKALLRQDDRGDPALERLYPNAYDDEDREREYRDLIGGELQAEKVRALDRIGETLSGAGAVRVDMDADATNAWLTGLTDIRLTLGSRLGVSDDLGSEEVDPDSPDAFQWSLLHWLGWLQEQLLEAIDPAYRRMYEPPDEG